MQKLVVSLLALSCSTMVIAQHAADSDGWTGDVSFGYLSSTGNTEDTSADLDFKVGLTVKPWGHEFKARGYGASKDEVTTAESYKAGWKSTYDFSEFNYSFGALDWNKDRFAGYTRQTFATVGYGRRVLTSDTYTLNLEVGVGYAKQRSAEVVGPPAIPAITDDGASGSLGGDFTWNISETSAFEQTLYIFTASDNTFWESVSKLRANVVGNLGLAVSYTVKQNTDVPPGTKKTDTLTSIGLTYTF